ncbi:unnamed protein product, partial [Sphenostylis stenocarpa]
MAGTCGMMSCVRGILCPHESQKKESEEKEIRTSQVKPDHVAASPVERKHIQTLIRFLILHNIFIRYHRTLEK